VCARNDTDRFLRNRAPGVAGRGDVVSHHLAVHRFLIMPDPTVPGRLG